jgi:hypothetical protein
MRYDGAMNPLPPRMARLVLVTPDGRLLGALPPIPTATPWWQDIEPVVRAVRERHRLDVTVLRLLEVGEPSPSGIEITYLAETAADGPFEPWEGDLDDHPLRLAYAKPGGPAADLAWAQGVLEEHGYVRTGPAAQVRTWNLSSLWRIPVRGQTLWLKVVPPFFAHEGDLLRALAGGRTPVLLGHQGGRMLMAEIPGEDLYGAPPPDLLRMVDLLVELQSDWTGRTEELLRLGLPDWRGASLARAIDAVIAHNASQLRPEDRASLEGFADDLSARFAEIAACGLPNTLVHGDYHPGNLRGDADVLTMLDWGDSGVGHPMLDQSAFLDRIAREAVEAVRAHWHAAWRAAAPGSDPDRASALLAPVAAARQAMIYQGFLDRIEPSEHPYHRDDPVDWLQRTAALVRAHARS